MMRVLVVDDEEPARRKLVDLLSREPDVEIVGAACDGLEAVRRLEAEEPDVVFLDVQMPGLDGFGVVEAVGAKAMPAIVFVTAFDEHAIRAFDANALDYLLKPFAPSRLARALERLRERLPLRTRRETADLAERLERALAASSEGPRYLRQLLVAKGANRHVLVAVETIDRIEAEKEGVRLRTAEGDLRWRGALSTLEARLDPERFLRINRSEIVRLEAVKEFQPWFHGDWCVLMRDGSTLTWSRRYRARTRAAFEGS